MPDFHLFPNTGIQYVNTGIVNGLWPNWEHAADRSGKSVPWILKRSVRALGTAYAVLAIDTRTGPPGRGFFATDEGKIPSSVAKKPRPGGPVRVSIAKTA